MTNTSPVPTPDRVGQGTAVEQSRAAAEVLGAIEAAQRWPRDTQRAIRDLQVACGMLEVAEHARFEYKRGKETVSGATVELARTIALCWQHIHYGIRELRRREDQSEILAYALDVQTGVRSDRIFILPHHRYLGKNKDRLIDLRDIQENNLSVGGRNVRETIFSVLPPWLRQMAIKECADTLVNGPRDSKGDRIPMPPLPVRVRQCIDGFAGMGVSAKQLMTKLDGHHYDDWTIPEVMRLGNIYRTIERGEASVKVEFPPDTISGAAIIAAAPPPASRDESTPDTVSPAEMHDQESQPVGNDH